MGTDVAAHVGNAMSWTLESDSCAMSRPHWSRRAVDVGLERHAHIDSVYLIKDDLIVLCKRKALPRIR